MIAFDNAASVWIGGTPSGSYTVGSSTNRILFAYIVGETTDSVTSCTYNGVAMTLITKVQNGTDRFIYLFYLVNPASGANTLAATGSVNPLTGYAASYSGASQSGVPDASGTNIGTTVSSLAKAITTIAANCWMVGCIFTSSTTYTGQAGTDIRAFDGAAPTSNRAIFDSNGNLTAGSNSLGINFGGSLASTAMIVASFAPSTVATGDPIVHFI